MVNYYGQLIINYQHLSVKYFLAYLLSVYPRMGILRKEIKRCKVAPSNILDIQLCFAVLCGGVDWSIPLNTKGSNSRETVMLL